MNRDDFFDLVLLALFLAGCQSIQTVKGGDWYSNHFPLPPPGCEAAYCRGK